MLFALTLQPARIPFCDHSKYYEAILWTNFERSRRINLDTISFPFECIWSTLDACFSKARRCGQSSVTFRRTRRWGRTGSWDFSISDLGISSKTTSITYDAFNAFWSPGGGSFHLLNEAYMILLRNKTEAHKINDFCALV
jgi:hypothetical protein